MYVLQHMGGEEGSMEVTMETRKLRKRQWESIVVYDTAFISGGGTSVRMPEL